MRNGFAPNKQTTLGLLSIVLCWLAAGCLDGTTPEFQFKDAEPDKTGKTQEFDAVDMPSDRLEEDAPDPESIDELGQPEIDQPQFDLKDGVEDITTETVDASDDEICMPQCEGKDCGDDGCQGSCGECPGPQDVCTEGMCLCLPHCGDKECGDDGCSGECGPCSDSLECTVDDCVGEQCEHVTHALFCLISEACLPSGAENPSNPCEKCQPAVSQAGWSPLPDGSLCGAGTVCHAGTCCSSAANCEGKECGTDGCGGECGVCAGPQDLCLEGGCICQPACDGKQCGPDGCGGVCGECPDPQYVCIEGSCTCQPDCMFKNCGPNGCGGSCGACTSSEVCTGTGKCGTVTAYCGSGSCVSWVGENCDTCPEDCGPCCGNGKCQTYYLETCESCPKDCGFCPLPCYDGNDVDWDGCTDGAISEFQVNSHTDDDQTEPAVASLSVGGFAILWSSEDQDGDNMGIFGQVFAGDGSANCAEFQVNQYSANDQEHPTLASLPDGKLIALWESDGQDGSGAGVFARLINGVLGTPIGNEFPVPSVTAGNQVEPDVVALGGGDFLVAWEGSGAGDAHGIYARLFDPDGTPKGADFQVNSYEPEAQMAPAAAVLNGGNVVIVWQSIDDEEEGWGIYGRHYSPSGVPVNGQFPVTAVASGSHERANLASLPGGGYVVAWQVQSAAGNDFVVGIQVFDDEGLKIGDELTFDSGTGGDQLFPSLTPVDSGFAVAWQGDSADDQGSGVYARLFSADGTPLAVAYQVSVFVSGDQGLPSTSAATNVSEGFVVSWFSKNQDGDSRGIFAQRFDANGKKIYH